MPLKAIPLVLAAALLAPAGCARKPAAPAEAVAEVDAHVGAPLTDEECRAFAAALEDAVGSGDVGAVNGLIDWDVLLERATAGAGSPAAKEEFCRGFRGTL